jgi:hypothetical protein
MYYMYLCIIKSRDCDDIVCLWLGKRNLQTNDSVTENRIDEQMKDLQGFNRAT